MHIKVNRFLDNGNATLSTFAIDDTVGCFVVEDTYREVKVKGQTRIPAGVYKVGVRNEGGMTKRYADKFPEFHQGMLWLRDVPNFEYVYIHIGNVAANTEGCLLVNYSANALNCSGSNSTKAYEDMYKHVIESAKTGDLTIEIIDGDRSD